MGERNDLIENPPVVAWIITDRNGFRSVTQSHVSAETMLRLGAVTTSLVRLSDFVALRTTIASLSEALAEAEKKGAEDWQPIDTAPKDRKILAGYFNRLGNWRTVTARYYVANTLPADDDSEEDFAPEGWYECSETNEHILQLEYPPTHWRPLPAPPRDLSQGGQHG